jgi:hypothetical protein
MGNLAEMLGTTVERHGDRTAVALDDIKLSYAAATTGTNDADDELILVEPAKFGERLGAAEPVTETAERDDDDPAEVEQG